MYDNISKDNKSFRRHQESVFLARVWEWRGIGTDCPGLGKRHYVLWSLLKTFFFSEIIIDKTLFLFKCLSKILSIALCNHTA